MTRTIQAITIIGAWAGAFAMSYTGAAQDFGVWLAAVAVTLLMAYVATTSWANAEDGVYRALVFIGEKALTLWLRIEGEVVVPVLDDPAYRGVAHGDTISGTFDLKRQAEEQRREKPEPSAE